MSIPSKITYADVTKDPKDIQHVRDMIKEAQNELAIAKAEFEKEKLNKDKVVEG